VQAWLQGFVHPPVAAIGADVAGGQLAARVRDVLGLPVHWMHSSVCAGGVRNGYATPNQLGADRWLALIGLAARAAHDPDTSLMLANYGTATTIDTLGPQGDDGARLFIGGLILPGVKLMRSSLAQHTAQLPLAQGLAAAFPTDTDAAIVSGVDAAQAGALVRQWRQALAHFGRAPVLHASGGDWHLVARTVQDAMHQIQTDLALPPNPLRLVQSPILDGLAQLGADGSKIQL